MKFAYFELPGNIGGSGVKMKVFVLIKIVYIFLGKVLPLICIYTYVLRYKFISIMVDPKIFFRLVKI